MSSGLCTEAYGDPGDPPLLLLAGATCSLDWWDERLCARLAAAGRHVIRFDQRDTGASPSCPPGAPDYDADALAADALTVLAEHGHTGRAHLVGISLGGMLALRIAVERPRRLATLTLLSTTPAGPGRGGLSPMAASLREPLPPTDWSGREQAIAGVLARQRRLAGRVALDEEWVRETAARAFDRSRDLAAAMTNHALVDATPPRERLHEIQAPALILHGTDDPLFTLEHGEALARELPHARLIALNGVGHQYPPPATWDVVVPAIVTHTARSAPWREGSTSTG